VIRMLSLLFRIVLVLFVVRLSLRAAVSLFAPRRTPPVPGGSSVDLVRDRVCNTFLPRSRAITATIAGHEEHFCSSACAQRALSESAGQA
jgi:uncharacterized protein